MNTLFSPARFKQLLLAHWAEMRSQYLWFIGIAATANLVFIFIAFSADSSYTYNAFQYSGQQAWYIAGLFITGLIFASMHFKQLVNPGPALIFLMRPASSFEKALLAVLVVSFLFPLVYSAFYCLMNYPIVNLASQLYITPAKCEDCSADFSFFFPFLTTGLEKTGEEPHSGQIYTQVLSILILWITQGLLLAGGAFFKDSPVAKTLLGLFFIWIAFLFFSLAPPASQMDNPPNAIAVIMYWAVFLALVWCVLFFNIREREVN